ncbi:hypothetical protein [Shewanella sp. SR44-3]|uniref:hypothetical protein n=1 Tax=Shewanella sp. SR44-3 TaxID=2760936 RepID=UPI0015FC5408|nr:hypothetical protein [Shewanella sp. SR44-3]MBB1269124.1 hypothetical protein [Shewanella sp. SR44-3]
MDRKLYLSVSKKTEGDLSDFFGELHKHKIVDKYDVGIVSDPVYYFRQNFIDEVVNNGFSSMLKFSIAMDDITTPSMHIDDIELVFHKFVMTLKPIKTLIIIDPYFYPKISDIDEISKKFIGLISPIINDLKKIIVISNGNNKFSIDGYISKLHEVNQNLEVNNHFSNDFHDRFWLNAVENKGIVVGTSVNGIGKKISLVDSLASSDVEQVLKELSSIIGD